MGCVLCQLFLSLLNSTRNCVIQAGDVNDHISFSWIKQIRRLQTAQGFIAALYRRYNDSANQLLDYAANMTIADQLSAGTNSGKQSKRSCPPSMTYE